MIEQRKTKVEDYEVLTEREHIRKRVGMYAGQIAPHTQSEYVFNLTTGKMEKRELTYIPALIKIAAEIIDNAIDEYKRHPNILTTIRVTIDENSISISDDGAGIPVEIHPTTGKYVPETVFTNLRAGSNFNDDESRMTIGTNGVGSSICVVLSKEFNVETCDGSHRFQQSYLNGLLEITEPKIKPNAKHGTTISFTPDFEYFGIQKLDSDHIQKIMKRVIDVAGCNTEVKFFLNGDRIHFKSFKDYIETYQDDFFFEEGPNWSIGIAHTLDDEFEQVSFVNGVETYNGGSHVDYIFNQLGQKLKEFFKKKHKTDITFGMLKNHIRLFISCNIDKPKFNSQTKDCMVSEVKNFGSSFEVTDKFIRKISQSSIVESVLNWIEAKEKAAELAELKKLNKTTNKTDPRKIIKFTDAIEKKKRTECYLFLTEGDSAAKAIQSGRGKNHYIGCFPLRGKFKNVSDTELSDIIENEEIKNILTITGLKLGEEVKSKGQLRFGGIVATTDADLDGFHITGLLQNFFFRFWPELFEMGMIYYFKTPLIKVWKEGKKKEELWFYDENEYKDWQEQNPNVKHKMKWYKGLGTSTPKEFGEYLTNIDKHLVPLSVEDLEDVDSIDLAFNKQRADDRKTWIALS